MLINPNLYEGPSKIIISPKNEKWNSGSLYLNDLNLVEGKAYTLTLLSEQTKNGPGTHDWGFFEKNIETPWKMGKVNTNSYEKIEFTYTSKIYRIILYPGYRGQSENIGATFYKIKIEEDEGTLYIPNENAIETAKRQYFIGGGYFKEVYPIS